MRWLKFIPYVLALTVAVWLFALHFPVSGVKSFTLAIDGRSPWLDQFLPGQRATVAGPREGSWVGQIIHDDPTYASARQPGFYDSVTWELEVRPVQKQKVALGLVRQLDPQQIELPTVSVEDIGDGWQRVSASFDRLPPFPDRLKFVLSVPDIKGGKGEVEVRRAILTYHRDPLSWSSFWQIVRHELSAVKKRLWS